MFSVLILLSTYNGTQYLETQLDSIRRQRDVYAKILVRDDGSLDETLQLLYKYRDNYPELFCDIIPGKNIGSTSSFLELLKMAYSKYCCRFDFFAFADQDDFWNEDKLAVGISFLKQFDDSLANLYCSATRVVDTNLIPLKGIRARKVILSKGRALARNVATGCTMVFNKRALELSVLDNPYVKIHDYAVYLVCSFMGNVYYDKNSYILYRQHGSNQIGGTDTIVTRYHDRLKRKGTLSEHYMERVAQAFLFTYQDYLTDEDKKLINILAFYRNSFWSRLQLLFSKDIAKEQFEDNFFFKLKVLLGGV